MTRRRRVVSLRWLAIAALVVPAACRFEARPPGGTRRDDAAVEATVTAFYAALAATDTAALARSAFAAGSALVDATGTDLTLVPLTALLGVPERRTLGRPPRHIRTEVRLEGSMASVRAVLALPSDDGAGEVEATDLLTLGWREGRWRVAHAQLGPWRLRSAP